MVTLGKREGWERNRRRRWKGKGKKRKEEGSEAGMIHSRVGAVAKAVTTSNMKTVERWQRHTGHHSNTIPIARLKQN